MFWYLPWYFEQVNISYINSKDSMKLLPEATWKQVKWIEIECRMFASVKTSVEIFVTLSIFL